MSEETNQFTQVVAYRGRIAIITPGPGKTPGMLNKYGENPNDLGIVLDAAHVQVSREAFDLLRTIKKSNDDIGDVDCFKSGEGKVIFAWLGGWKAALDPARADTAQDTDCDLLRDRVVENLDAPQDFRDWVDEADALSKES